MPTINFAGLASGIDSNALIDALSQSTRQARIVPNEDKVTELEETNSIFAELKEKLTALQGIAQGFSTARGGALSKTSTSTDETNVTASASNSATNGTYTVTVSSKAKNHTFSFNDRYADPTTAIYPTADNGAGADAASTVTFTIGNETPQKTVAVRITSTMTAAGFVTAFNENALATAPGYATASLVNVGTTSAPSYAIMVNTNHEGLLKGEIASVGLGANLITDGIFASSSEDPASDAEFTVSGIAGTITRSNNIVGDVIQGLTLTIQDTGAATISVGDDIAKTQSTVQEFIDAYNEIVQFINENNKITREEDGENVENIFSPLAKSRTDDNFLIAIRNSILAARNQTVTASTEIAVNTMADLGIVTERDGTLKFITDDPSAPNFKNAMSADPSLVNAILMRFGDIVGTVAGRPDVFPGGGVIHQYIKFNGLIDVSVNGNKSLITNLNDRISVAEAFIRQQEENLRKRFARLESLTGQLQGQQQALTSALAGLGGGS